jgi:hypothetical protein
MGLVGVVLGLAVPLVFGVIAGIGVAVSGDSGGDLPSGVLIALTFVQDIGFIAAALFVARMARRPTARDFGLVRTQFWRAVGIVIGVYIAFYAFAGIWAPTSSARTARRPHWSRCSCSCASWRRSPRSSSSAACCSRRCAPLPACGRRRS